MWTGVYRSLLPALGLLVLTGCTSFLADKQASMPAAEAQGQAAYEAAAPQRRSAADDVRELLRAAEAALTADKLTTPLHDNAFDRFQAVLLLDPNNAQARTGLQQVFSRYITMIRSALVRNDLGRARAMLERARLVQHDHPALDELESELLALRERLEQQNQGSGLSDAREFILDGGELARKEQQLVERLKELALQVKESEESLLIIARNDAEGRWIYQRMSEGVPDYRLRGDIQLGRTPRILILPPFD